ncbi:MAG: DUF1611 domain-containing protein [Pseudomonadota bacterium]
MMQVRLKTPYLIFLGDVGDDGHAKTGRGIAVWRPELCAGQMRLTGCEDDLGLPELDTAGAVDAGIGTVIVGIASTGGVLLDHWIPALCDLARAGMDIAAGTHAKLNDNNDLAAAAKEGNARLIDVRIPPHDIEVGDGRPRTGKRVLMVGTDCAVGKKYTALALHRELESRGVKATFRATGQTGIMIAGEGIPMDAVVSDFLSGAAEALTPDNDDDHWDVIEGQGCIVHPGYAAVTVGLLHGSQPDAVVLCHDPTRDWMIGLEDQVAIPSIDDTIAAVLSAARATSDSCVWAGISVNTSSFTPTDRADYLSRTADRYEVPCVDPIATGIGDIADFLTEHVK